MNFEENLIQTVQLRLQLEKRKFGGVLPDGKVEETIHVVYEEIKVLKNDDEEIDIDSLVRDLRSKYTVSMVEEIVSLATENHKPWLTDEIKNNWRFFKRYKDTLIKKNSISDIAIEKMDSSTDRIMDFLMNPETPGSWDQRGLVKGYVQSGKTMNYAGLVNKALDVGYKFIIILAGRANNLRSQTQIRIDQDVIGIDTEQKLLNRKVYIGVGNHHDPALQSLNVNFATTTLNDFNRASAINLGLTDPGGVGFIIVIKKNVSILRNALNFIQQNWSKQDSPIIAPASGTNNDTELKLIDVCPLLLIDDEADDSSIDTRDGVIDDNDDNPDPEHEPTQTNAYIRRILHSFKQSCYIGYTATPYANAFIHHRGHSPENGDDLFPRDFIVSLPRPENYIGPDTLFPINHNPNHKSLIININDNLDDDKLNNRIGWMPPRHRTSHTPRYKNDYDSIPPSLKQAIHAFLISAAGARVRRKEQMHNTMLINVSAWVNVHLHIKRQVEQYTILVARSLKAEHEDQVGSIASIIKKLWFEEFKEKLNEDNERNYEKLDWQKISKNILKIASEVQVLRISGGSQDALDYKNSVDEKLCAIIIGGHKLSRGLTLEGLSVSYFLRSPNIAVHDTVMQMGRWFGYRPGYSDLCRIYMNQDMEDRFSDFAEAEEDFTNKLKAMEKLKLTPLQFGLSIEESVNWMFTARNKRRTAENINLDYSGSTNQTRWLSGDKDHIKLNWKNFEDFIHKVDKRYQSNFEFKDGNLMWRNIPPELITEFLSNYKDSDRSKKTRGQFLNLYIDHRVNHNELLNWTVVVKNISGNNTRYIKLLNKDIQLSERTNHNNEGGDFEPKAMKSTNDEYFDLPDGVTDRPADSGLLMIIPVQIKEEEGRKDPLEKDNFVSFVLQCGISNDLSPGKRILTNSVAQELFIDSE